MGSGDTCNHYSPSGATRPATSPSCTSVISQGTDFEYSANITRTMRYRLFLFVYLLPAQHLSMLTLHASLASADSPAPHMYTFGPRVFKAQNPTHNVPRQKLGMFESTEPPPPRRVVQHHQLKRVLVWCVPSFPLLLLRQVQTLPRRRSTLEMSHQDPRTQVLSCCSIRLASQRHVAHPSI